MTAKNQECYEHHLSRVLVFQYIFVFLFCFVNWKKNLCKNGPCLLWCQIFTFSILGFLQKTTSWKVGANIASHTIWVTNHKQNIFLTFQNCILMSKSGCSPWRSQTLRFASKMYTNVILRNYSPRSDSDRGESSLRCFWCPYLSDVKEQCFAIPKQYFNIKILCFDAQKIFLSKKKLFLRPKGFFTCKTQPYKPKWGLPSKNQILG